MNALKRILILIVFSFAVQQTSIAFADLMFYPKIPTLPGESNKCDDALVFYKITCFDFAGATWLPVDTENTNLQIFYRAYKSPTTDSYWKSGFVTRFQWKNGGSLKADFHATLNTVWDSYSKTFEPRISWVLMDPMTPAMDKYYGLTNASTYDGNITSVFISWSNATLPISGSSGSDAYGKSPLSGGGATQPVTGSKSFVSDPINAATGSHILERQILSATGARQLVLTARYDSLLLKKGPMGNGWGHNFETWLEVVSSSQVRIHWDANRQNTFTNNAGIFSSTEPVCIYDALVKNVDNSYTLTRKDGTAYYFTPSGKLTAQKNLIGQSLNFSYDVNGRLTIVNEPISGASLTFTYDTSGLLASVKDPLNRQANFNYNASGNLTAITNPSGKTVSYTYNTENRVLTAVNAEGTTIFTNTYDSNGRVVTQKDAIPASNLSTLSYDESSQSGKVIPAVFLF